ncbi:hypothetical protein LZ198_22675 [Myxococcus sp. K15C18031901]|uniref:hypothetical protein n=1 Tax=Myxococcus dinghuensis TaxID=2906761 RepID=UPI0020A75F51|nr:hypothetical protein [Myxococcus dinghuensis]MCP3101687.1 hypothetical protein [Myxococcus dinghuensis]
MKAARVLFAVVTMCLLGACGAMQESDGEVSEPFGQSEASLNTCTNDCIGTGGPAISCSGNTCSSAGNYVVCDGVFTYCQTPPQPNPCDTFSIRCPNGSTLRCRANTQSCEQWTTCSIMCDGVERKCATPPGQVCAL